MNKLFTFLIASMLMIGMVNAAPGTPMPFVVIVDTFTPGDAVGMEVIVRDITHPYTMVLTTNEYGEAAGDWANSPIRGEIGDLMEITAGSKTVNAVMQDYGLDIIHVNLMETTKDCPLDTTPYSLETCPVNEVIKEVIKEVPVEVIKEVIVEVPASCPEPKDWTNETLLAVFAILSIAFGAYKGYYRFQTRKKVYRTDGTYYYTWETKVQKVSTGTTIKR